MHAASPSTTLQDEHHTMTALVALMQQEQQHLINAEIDQLTALTVQKSQAVHQMANLARQRHQALGRAGFAAAESGMQPWLAAGDDSAASALWQELLALTRVAKELNRVNGMLIGKQMSNNQGALNALRAPGQGSAGFYGPSGHATAATSSGRFVIG